MTKTLEIRNKWKGGRFLAGLLSAVSASAALPYVVVADEPVTAWADAISVEIRANECRTISPCAIGYSPVWGDVTNEGAYVVLEKVERAGMYDAMTNTLATFAADASGEYSYTVGNGDEQCVRLIHRVYSSGGVEIGTPLVRDVLFGTRSSPGAAFVADSRTNSLQLAATSGSPVNLSYSTAWATNAAAVAIKAVMLSGKDGSPVATNVMFSAVADTEGTTQMCGLSLGWWRLLCEVSDGSGDALIEYLTDEFKLQGGFIMSVR